jgi:hypothetical protein
MVRTPLGALVAEPTTSTGSDLARSGAFFPHAATGSKQANQAPNPAEFLHTRGRLPSIGDPFNELEPFAESELKQRNDGADSDPSGSTAPLATEALVGVVETALAETLRLAAEAERWELVAQLAEELAKRRRERSGDATPRAATLAARRGTR